VTLSPPDISTLFRARGLVHTIFLASRYAWLRFHPSDMLRWTAFAAAAPVLGLADPARAHAATRASGTGEIEPVNLELVTLTEDRAVITWYTGEAGTNDGLDRMVPAPADGEVWYGTDPARLKNVAGDISGKTPTTMSN
jgi:3',5'-cyclic-AMP phosphodiesterase